MESSVSIEISAINKELKPTLNFKTGEEKQKQIKAFLVYTLIPESANFFRGFTFSKINSASLATQGIFNFKIKI